MPEAETIKKLPQFVPLAVHGVEFVQSAMFIVPGGCSMSEPPVPGINISLSTQTSGSPERPLTVNLPILEALKLCTQLRQSLNSIATWGAEGVTTEMRRHLARELDAK